MAPDRDPPRLEGEPTVLAPSAELPDGVVSQVAHNNLDVVEHDGRMFFAFRTGPFHRASAEVVMYVVSRPRAGGAWRFEQAFDFDRDLREPRFLSLGSRLFFYFAMLGTDPLAFEPGESRVSEYLGPGEWSTPETAFGPSFIPWRARVLDGVAYVIGYEGGEGIYDPEAPPITIHWLTTEDGEAFEPVVDGQAVMLSGGGSETDWAFLPDGGLVAVVRNEAGEGDDFGSKICRAPASDLGTWTCAHDPRKYDSPLVFAHGEHVYLIARRQLAHDGAYDLDFDGASHTSQYWSYQAEYVLSPKRCALWEVDAEALTVSFVLDLPSRGDTCFPSMLPGDTGEDGRLRVAVYNYTSPLDGDDLTWAEGQAGPTVIYEQWLSLPAP